MCNPFILKMWVKTKIKEFEREIQVCNTEADAYKLQGKLDILMEFYDDFNLEEIDEKEVIIHNNF
jgi:hypothetical protein